MAGYNLTRSVEELLDKTELSPPSFTVHLHPEHWILNNGHKYMYNIQIASLLDDIRAHRIPVDFLELFDSAQVPFYDGCMIVELLDYRPAKIKEKPLDVPDRTRVVLHPNSETLWADICLLNHKLGNKWTDSDALEIEARLLMATAPPLCLNPDPHLTRIANNVLRVSTPTVPVSLKRKATALEAEEDETDKARRAKIMQFMNPRTNRSHTPSYRILDAIQSVKMAKEGRPPSTAPSQPIPPPAPAPPETMQPPLPQPTPAPVTNIAPSAVSAPVEDPSHKKMKQVGKKSDAKQPYTVGDATGNATNASGSTIIQFHAMQPPSSSASESPVQPPAQQFNQSPKIPASQPSQTSTLPSQPQSQPQVQPQSQSQSQPQPQPQPQSQPATFQPPIPSAGFLSTPPSGPRNGQAKSSASNASAPQSIPAQPNQAALQAAPAHMQLFARLNAAAQSQTGRSTPQGPPLSRSPMNPSPSQAQRSSPLVTNQALTSTTRSPMPPNAQAVQQVTHPPQQHIAFPPHLTSTQAAQFRAMVQASGSPHPQNFVPHLANQAVAATTTSQDQQQTQPHAAQMMNQYAQMYPYPQMGVNYPMQPRLPAGYTWQQMRGIPGVANGHHPMPGMIPNANHPQQVGQVGVGKAVPGQLQGR